MYVGFFADRGNIKNFFVDFETLGVALSLTNKELLPYNAQSNGTK